MSGSPWGPSSGSSASQTDWKVLSFARFQHADTSYPDNNLHSRRPSTARATLRTMVGIMAKAAITIFVSFTPVSAQSAMGLSTCSCIDAFTGSFDVASYDCNKAYAVNGKCIQATMSNGDKFDYPANYGLTCKKHIEPGTSSCWNMTTGVELPTADQADWCGDSWCYVDPCACDSNDAKRSDYFPTKLTFSYATCGAADKYSTTDGTNTDATCNSAQASFASGAEASFVAMFGSLMFAIARLVL